MSSDWQENLDDIIPSFTRIQEDIDKIPMSRRPIPTDTHQLFRSMDYGAIRLKNMLEYIEDLGFQDSND